MEYKPQFWKENYGAFRDKYQHSWSVGAPLSDHQIDDSNKENCLQNHNVKKRKSMDNEEILSDKKPTDETTKENNDESCDYSDGPCLKRQKLVKNENTENTENVHEKQNENGDSTNHQQSSD